MYFPNFFGLPPRDRVDNPLDLSVKQAAQRADASRPPDRLLMDQKLSSVALTAQPPLLEPLYSYKSFDPSCHLTAAPLLSHQSLAGGYSSAHPINHLGLIPDLLHQSRDPLLLEGTHFGSPLPYHMRIGSSAAAVMASQRAYFGHPTVLSPHMSSYGNSIPHSLLYGDLMSDMTRRSAVNADKALFAIPGIRPPEPSTRFSDHLQRLREQHMQTKCSGPCCMPSSVHSGTGHSTSCTCCEMNVVPLPTSASTLVMPSHSTPTALSLSSCGDDCNRELVANKSNHPNHCLNSDNKSALDDLTRHVTHPSLVKESPCVAKTRSETLAVSGCSPKGQSCVTSCVRHQPSECVASSDSTVTVTQRTDSERRAVQSSSSSVKELEIITLDEECSENETKSEVKVSDQEVSREPSSMCAEDHRTELPAVTTDQSVERDQKAIVELDVEHATNEATDGSRKSFGAVSGDRLGDNTSDGLNSNTSDTKQECLLSSSSGLTLTVCESVVSDSQSHSQSATVTVRGEVGSGQSQESAKASLKLKDYKPVPKQSTIDKSKRTKETKTVEVQCDGPEWTPIVLPVNFRAKLEKALRNKLLKNRSSLWGRNSEPKKRKKCKQKHFHHNRSRSRSRSSSASSRKSSPERHHSSDCARNGSKARKRSMLQCLSNSEGYVADKIRKSSSELNLIKSDPSELGREERALQRAIKHFDDLSQPNVAADATTGHSGLLASPDVSRKSKADEQPNEVKDDESTLANTSPDVTDTYRMIIESVVNQSRCHRYCSEKTAKNAKKSIKTDEKVSKTKQNKESEELSIESQTKAKAKKKCRSESSRELSDRKQCKTEPNQTKTNTNTNSNSNSRPNQNKKAMVSVRRRRFRSGLDMIRQPHRKKKTKPNLKRPKEKGLDDMSHKSNHLESGQTSVPTEIKRLMVNKALGETLLHRAARSNRQDVVNLCLQSGSCDVNARDNANYTPLHECSTRGHLRVVRTLLENGADVNASATGGIRPLHDAIENNHMEVVRLLLAYGADPNITTYSGATPLQLCRSKAMLKFLKGFLTDISVESLSQHSTHSLAWKFSSSLSCAHSGPHGFDPLADVPPPDCQSGRSRDQNGLVFEHSDQPMDPTYRLTNKESDRFVRLAHLLKRTGLTREQLTKKHSDLSVVSVTRGEMEANPTHVRTAAECESSGGSDQSESLVLMDEKVRSMLGIETLLIS